MTLIDVGLAHPGAHRLGAVAELLSNPQNCAVLGAELGTQGPYPRFVDTGCDYAAVGSVAEMVAW